MISSVKFVAVLSAVCVASGAIAAKTDDGSTPKPETKEAGGKKKKKGKADGEKKTVDVPVEKGHDSFGMSIPYFDGTGKREMNFKIGVASRIDDNHIKMKDLQIETLNEAGQHEMAITMPTSILDTDTSIVTSHQHVTINRSDFELTGESLIFNTRTKQGGLGGNVRMVIYNLQEETGENNADGTKKDIVKPAPADGAKTTGDSTEAAPPPGANTPQPNANTPKPKASIPKLRATTPKPKVQ